MAYLKKRNGKWHVRYVDECGKQREKAVSRDKAISRQMMARIVRDVEMRRAGLADDFTRHARQPIAVYLGEYRQDLESSGITDEHVSRTIRMCEKIVDGCGWTRIADIDETQVRRWLKRQRDTRTDFGLRSSNKHSTAIKSFARWLWITRKTPTHLLVGCSGPRFSDHGDRWTSRV